MAQTRTNVGRRARSKRQSRGARLLETWRGEMSQRDAAVALGLTDGRHFAKLLSGEVGAGLEVAMRIQAATGGKVPASAWLEYDAPEQGRKAS